MSELILRGTVHSTCSRRVLVVAEELGITLKIVGVDFTKAENKSEDYLSKQPFGQIPYLDDDGFILYESRAICKYLAAKVKSKLLPDASTDLKAFAKFEEAVSVEAFNFDPPAHDIVVEKVFAKYRGREPDEEVVKKNLVIFAKKLEGYERILSKQKYIAGDEITLADFFHLSYGAMLQPALNEDVFAGYPNTERWFKELQERPSWKAVLARVAAGA